MSSPKSKPATNSEGQTGRRCSTKGSEGETVWSQLKNHPGAA